MLLRNLTNVWGQLTHCDDFLSPGYWNFMNTACRFYCGFSRQSRFFGSSMFRPLIAGSKSRNAPQV